MHVLASFVTIPPPPPPPHPRFYLLRRNILPCLRVHATDSTCHESKEITCFNARIERDIVCKTQKQFIASWTTWKTDHDAWSSIAWWECACPCVRFADLRSPMPSTTSTKLILCLRSHTESEKGLGCSAEYWNSATFITLQSVRRHETFRIFRRWRLPGVP